MPSWPNYIRLEADPSEGYVEIEYSLSVQDPVIQDGGDTPSNPRLICQGHL